jgi:hypothetical protein
LVDSLINIDKKFADITINNFIDCIANEQLCDKDLICLIIRKTSEKYFRTGGVPPEKKGELLRTKHDSRSLPFSASAVSGGLAPFNFR